MTHGHLLPQGLAEAYSAATGIEVSGIRVEGLVRVKWHD